MNYLKSFFRVLISILLAGNLVQAQEVVDPSTLNNKIMAGYQGWFAASGDGSGYGWIHWSRGTTPDADNITIDFWPDMREYDADELFETNFIYRDFTKAGLYSAYTRKTVERHVKWMKDYGIDGVFVQRFLGSAASRRDLRDTVLQNVRYGAEKYGRAFANMYDLSGGTTETLVQWIKTDWMHLVDDLKILESPNYLHHNGRPVLSIWGFGLSGRPGTPVEAAEIIQWLTKDAPEKYRVTLKGGVDDKWQSHSAEWQAVYEMFDILSPWAVGRYGDIEGADNFRESKIEPDLLRTQNLNIDYMPVVFPGFSWFNLKEGASPLNQRPRNGGKFLWHQFYNTVDAGCNMVYVAMFDEVDEGTAIYKLAENEDQIPITGAFVTLDADGYKLPSDWYLRLTGEASRMLRGEISLTDEIPIVAYPDKAEFVSQEVPTFINPGETHSVSINFKNAGTTTWTKFGGYSLVCTVDSALDTWGSCRVELDTDDSIAHGENKTFSFNVTAPNPEGVYGFQWSLLKEGGGPIDDASAFRLINVSANPVLLDDCDNLGYWTSSGSLSLNDIDRLQGTGCIEFTGSTGQDAEFQKVFPVPFNSGLKEYDAALQFWYYVSDASFLPNGLMIELGSGSPPIDNSYSWDVDGLAAGWNLITLYPEDAMISGAPDLNAINWFSIKGENTGTIISRIDEIQLLDKNSGKTKYNLIVNHGSGSGQYVEDSFVKINADEAIAGSEFVGWKVISGNPLFEDASAAQTRIRMRDSHVEVTAQYKMFGKYLDDCDYLNGWGSSGSITLNVSDPQEGSGCIEFSGSQTDEFRKVFESPHNSGVSAESGRLELWYYVSDASLLGPNNQLELGSGGRSDLMEYNWNLSGLKNGWNFISLKFSDANITGTAPNLSAINWFRIYNFKLGSITSRIDAIEIVDPEAGEKFPLTIRSGSGDGSFYQGTVVNIIADEPPQGYTFENWTIESGNPLITDLNAANTSLIMGNGSVLVQANYTLAYYTLGIQNGSGEGNYAQGTVVSIEAFPAPDGYVFDRWIIETGNPVIANATAPNTSLTMGSEPALIKASYKIITYLLTIQNGYGSGNYPDGELVGIKAYPPPVGFEFDQWTVKAGNPVIEDPYTDSTTLTMRGNATVVVAAEYKLKGTGIHSNEGGHGVMVFPNPASQELSIQLTLEAEARVKILLLDLSGRVLNRMVDDLRILPGDNLLKFPISGILPGSYILKISVKGDMITRLLIIQ